MKLRRAGGLFHVSFFASYDAVWARHPACAALRSVLQRHLSASAAILVTHHESPSSAGFAQHLATMQPTFVLTSDALAADLLAAFPPPPELNEDGSAVVVELTASLAALNTNPVSSLTAPAAEDPLTPFLAVQALTLAAIMQILSLRVNVAYVSALQFNSLTMYGFLASSDKAYALLANRAASISAVTKRVCEYAMQGCPAATAALPALGQASDPVGKLGWRMGAGVLCCAAALSAHPVTDAAEVESSAWLARTWLLHLSLLPQLTLEQRALQALPASGDAAMAIVMASPPVASFLKHVFLTLAAAAAALPLASPKAAEDDEESEEDSDSDEDESDDEEEAAARAAARKAARETAAAVLRAQQHELADSYDGRLFARLLLLLHVQGQVAKSGADPLGLPESASQQFQAALSALAVHSPVLLSSGMTDSLSVMEAMTHPPAALSALLEPVSVALQAATATAAAAAAAQRAAAAAQASVTASRSRMSDGDDDDEEEDEEEAAGGGFVDAVLGMCGARDQFDTALLGSPGESRISWMVHISTSPRSVITTPGKGDREIEDPS